MHGKFASHIRTNIVGYLALFVALSGTAYAATAKRNSVATKSIRSGAVTNAKLATRSVDGSKVLDGSLTGADTQDASIQSADLAASAIGDPGFAIVSGSGSKSADRGVVGVQHTASSGRYCFNLSFTAQNGVASLNAAPGNSAKLTAQVQVPGGPAGLACPPPFDDAGVQISDADIATVNDDASFFIQFD
jgi:hypothetical protein